MSRRNSVKKSLNLTPLENEVVTLRAVLDMVGDMVNYETMTFCFRDPDSSIAFKTTTHMAFFNIILVDLLSKPSQFFASDKNYVDRLKDICESPLMGKVDDIQELRKAFCAFAGWLSEKVAIQNSWFPSLTVNVDLNIQRQDFIHICGNIAKHNFTRLTRVAENLQRILEDNGHSVSLGECITALEDFRARFYNDVFQYHVSTIAEFLNNIRWGIYSYASALRLSSVENSYDDKHNLNRYKYLYPTDVTSDMGKTCFWNLMNDVKQPPYVQRFEVMKYLKMRY